MRNEAHSLVILLGTLVTERELSKHPQMYDNAVKQTRRKVLGMYRQMTNHWVKHYEVPAKV